MLSAIFLPALTILIGCFAIIGTVHLVLWSVSSDE